MKIVTIKETALYENRVAITPDTASLFGKMGHNVIIQKGSGSKANFSDQAYLNAGALVKGSIEEVVNDADIILKLQATSPSDMNNELNFAKEGSIIIGYSKWNDYEKITALLKHADVINIPQTIEAMLIKTNEYSVFKQSLWLKEFGKRSAPTRDNVSKNRDLLRS